MFRPVSIVAAHSVLALAGLVSTTASATEVCDLYTTYVSCDRECYSLIAPVISAECDLTNAVISIEADAFAPPPSPLITCSRSGGSVSCQAWPQSDELSYSWSGDNSAATNSLTYSPYRTFACGAGTVSVSIVTSAGATAVATTTVPSCN